MLLTCHELSKSFGINRIIDKASFGIEAHEKAAIVGINGAGKSTLLKMITGELPCDSGQINLPKTARLGYLAQQEMLSVDTTVWEAMKDARANVIEAEQQLRRMERDMKQLSGEELTQMMDQYHALGTWFEQENGYALESEITGVLKGLGFSEEDFHRNTRELSGGQKTRVALGRLLLSEPDIILLDEPTNHLDMQSISWLENYLHAYKGTVLIVAHDRYFLDRVVTKIIEIDQGEVTVFYGNYTEYARQKKIQRDARLKAWVKQQDQIRHQQEVITKLRSFNREKSIRRAESREKLLQKMIPVTKPLQTSADMKLDLKADRQSGKDVLTVENLRKAYDSNLLFTDLSLLLRRGERVALIGDNGVGKTTLLKIIDGMVEADEGTVRLGTNVTIGYYDQDHRILHADKTLFDEISDSFPDMDQTAIRNVLATFLFTGDDVFKLSGELSGGERGRISLAKLMLSGANLLLLDEPTNHLDMISREILEDALRSYDGTVLYVSHDRYFINRTATRILEMSGCSITGYEGDYDYYLTKKEQLLSSDAGNTGKENTPMQDSGKQQWIRDKQQQAVIRRQRTALKRIEDEIARLETAQKEIDDQLMLECNATDPQALLTLANKKEENEKSLAALYEEWEQLMEDI